MSTLYADNFNRADTAAGAGLGTTSTGSLTWTVLTGTNWRIASNRAYTTDTITTNPLAVVTLPSSQADASMSLGASDCLYFRVVDASNWWRIRYSGVSSSGMNVGSWSAWSDWSADLQGCGSTISPCVSGYSNYVEGYATLNTECRASYGPCSTMNAYRTQSRSVWAYSYTTYTITLEKCVAGVVTTESNPVNTSTSKVRARSIGDEIEWFRFDGTNWVTLGKVTSSVHNTAVKFGVGRGSSSSVGSAIDDFNLIHLVAAEPTAITPVASATIATDVPVLGMTLTSDTVGGVSQKGQWQLATDAGFTSNVRTVTESDNDIKESGPTTEITPNGQALFQGTWYIRGRAVLPGGGAESPYATATTFTVSHPPAAATLFPANGASTASQAGNAFFSWAFTDTSPVDSQTAYEIEIQRTSDSLSIVTTGKVASIDNFASIAVDLQYYNIPLRWRVRLYDRDDVVGEWSSYSQCSIVLAPVAVILTPANGSNVTAPTVVVAWTYTGDLQQAAWKVRVETDAGDMIHDTGWTTGASTSYTPPPIFSNGVSYVVFVTVRDTGGHESLVAQSAVDAAWIAPTESVVNLYDYGETLGYIDVVWDWVQNDPEFVTWQVYRKPADGGDWTLLHTTFENINTGFYGFQDYTAKSQTTYQYAVVQTANRFGVEITSSFGGRVDSTWSMTVGSGDANTSGAAVYIAPYLYLNDVDSGGVNQSQGLAALAVGSVLRIGDWAFKISAITDNTTHYRYTGTIISGVAPQTGVVRVHDTNEVTPESSHYWMLFEDDPSSNFRLPMVTAETFSEEYERAEFNIIGRGRHVDVGERIGIKGQLTFELRGDSYLGLTAGDQIDAIMAASARQTAAMVRNPFGDLWLVSLGDISYERMAGVGLREYCTVTIPYSEVYG